MSNDLWQRCFHRLKSELPAQQFNTWIKPLEAEENDSYIRLLAPNRFIKNFVHDKFVGRIEELLDELKNISAKLLNEQNLKTVFLKPIYGDASGVRGAALLGRQNLI